MNDLISLTYQSVHILKMDSDTLMTYMNQTNQLLGDILKDEDTFSYDIYWSLLILNHNFRSAMNSEYLNDNGQYSYFKKKITSYYENGGNREILPYLIGFNQQEKEKLGETIIHSQQQFIVNTFCRGYEGLSNELKHFCEVPDFYPEITPDIVKKVYMKKDS